MEDEVLGLWLDWSFKTMILPFGRSQLPHGQVKSSLALTRSDEDEAIR